MRSFATALYGRFDKSPAELRNKGLCSAITLFSSVTAEQQLQMEDEMRFMYPPRIIMARSENMAGACVLKEDRLVPKIDEPSAGFLTYDVTESIAAHFEQHNKHARNQFFVFCGYVVLKEAGVAPTPFIGSVQADNLETLREQFLPTFAAFHDNKVSALGFSFLVRPYSQLELIRFYQFSMRGATLQ